ncbi:MAG: hypothetical protein JSW25_01435 [Thermoplasmata archaeon]|nr:MAG: hypothetical protein JSW25_01435 [Thermoplasmata archaeon]
MDWGLVGVFVSIIGGVIAFVGVLVLANSEHERTNMIGEVGEASGPGLHLIYIGLAAVGAGIVIMLAQ